MNLAAASIFVVGLLCVNFVIPARAETIEGKIVGVHDGDTLTLLVNDHTLKVRLAYIDAPELAQPYGQRSKQGLAALVFGKHVTIETHGHDRYGRTIGSVSASGQDVGLDMVRNGLAWAYGAYLPPACRVVAAKREVASAAVLGGFGRDPVSYQGMLEHCPLLAAEAEAREQRRGLWALQPDQRIAPWEWRHRQ